MGRGEEDGGFFDCYLQGLSLSRTIGPQQQKKHKLEDSDFFCYLLTFRLHFFHIRPTFLSVLRCIVRLLCLFSSVFSSSLFNFSNFPVSPLFFRSFPLVEGPNSDILSRIRFSVFLRIPFGVSSSSSSSSITYCRHIPSAYCRLAAAGGQRR